MSMPSAFDWRRAVLEYRRRLPHVCQAGAIYFVTFRTADSVPQALIAHWQVEAQRLRSSDSLHPLREMERHLDQGRGVCPLRDPRAARIVADALHYFDGQRYELDEYVVMPNHVHVLVCPNASYALTDILQSWKRFSARRINVLLGRQGRLWQQESFDHIVRDEQALERFRSYIRNNPARLPHGGGLLGKGRLATTMMRV